MNQRDNTRQVGNHEAAGKRTLNTFQEKKTSASGVRAKISASRAASENFLSSAWRTGKEGGVFSDR
jgi:hypothetical protein